MRLRCCEVEMLPAPARSALNLVRLAPMAAFSTTHRPAEYNFSWDALSTSLRESLRALTEQRVMDPTVEDLQRALGPPQPDYVVTVLVGMEDVLIKREWDVSSGAGGAELPRHGRVLPCALPPEKLA
jgi:hypothetical protein